MIIRSWVAVTIEVILDESEESLNCDLFKYYAHT